ncbi:MAG: alpha/beta hydrolase, partial [bacterium]|nr:alpha/beta hydrolase [bacterium]
MNQLVDREARAIALHSLADWEAKRALVLDAMQEVMGPLPGDGSRCSLDVKVDEEVDCGTYVR